MGETGAFRDRSGGAAKIGGHVRPLDRYGTRLGRAFGPLRSGQDNLADLSPTIESYKTLVAKANAKDLHVIVENHGSAAAHPEELVNVLKTAGAGALPDFGNFPDEAASR